MKSSHAHDATLFFCKSDSVVKRSLYHACLPVCVIIDTERGSPSCHLQRYYRLTVEWRKGCGLSQLTLNESVQPKNQSRGKRACRFCCFFFLSFAFIMNNQTGFLDLTGDSDDERWTLFRVSSLGIFFWISNGSPLQRVTDLRDKQGYEWSNKMEYKSVW